MVTNNTVIYFLFFFFSHIFYLRNACEGEQGCITHEMPEPTQWDSEDSENTTAVVLKDPLDSVPCTESEDSEVQMKIDIDYLYFILIQLRLLQITANRLCCSPITVFHMPVFC